MIDLKSTTANHTVIRLREANLAGFADSFSQTVSQAPKIFQEANIVLDLSRLQNGITPAQLNEIKRSIYATGASLLGVQNVMPAHQDLVRKSGLSIIHVRRKTEDAPTENIQAIKSLRIQGLVRSGMQVYAKQQSLLVLGHVARGAEVIADGHVIVLGNLLGKAIAGVKGSELAGIFCNHFAAELVAIAGVYALSDELDVDNSKPCAISFRDGRLCVQAAHDYSSFMPA